MSLIFVLIPLFAGIGLSMQSTVNGTLGREIGVLESAFLSFFSGSLLLIIIVVFFGQGNILLIFDAPFIQLLCAVFGVIFLLIMPYVSPRIGITNAMLMVIIGQLISSMMIDHFGFFGSKVVAFDYQRLFGLLLLSLAAYFIFAEFVEKEKF